MSAFSLTKSSPTAKDHKDQPRSVLDTGGWSLLSHPTDEEKKTEAPSVAAIREQVFAPPSAPLAVSGLLRASLMKGSKHYRTVIGLTGSMTTSGTGAINSTILNSSLGPTAEFVLFAGLFDEFFIHSFTANFIPFNQFMTNPSSSLPSGLYATGLILGAPIYHGATTYASATAMASNVDVKCLSTAKPFSIKWVNNEDPKSKVSTSSSTSSPTATQSWCLTSATSAALYQGTYQFRSNTNFANVLSTTVGDFLVRYQVTFRARA